MARSRSRARFVRPAPRTKMWIGAGVGSTALAASTKILVSTLSAGALLLRPFTVLRTRQLIAYRSDQSSAAEAPFGSYGKVVVTSTAAGIGVTAVPNPSGIDGDPEADWFVWQAMSHIVQFQTGSGFTFGGSSQYVIDSKAMRKVGPDDDIVSMFDQQAAVGATLVSNGRMLIQLH